MDDARTVWCGNLSDQVTEELLYELFLQIAPLERVKIPTDREGRKSSFGFVTFKHEVSVPYAIQMLHGIRMFDKNLNVKPRNGGTQQDKNMHQQSHHSVQRSLSYPNDEPRQNLHARFPDIGEGPQYISYDSLMHMGQVMNASYSEGFDDRFINNYGSNVDNERQQWDRNNSHDREHDRGQKQNERSRDDYEAPRDRRNYSNNRNNRRRNNDRRHHHYDKNGGRRNHRRF